MPKYSARSRADARHDAAVRGCGSAILLPFSSFMPPIMPGSGWPPGETAASRTHTLAAAGDEEGSGHAAAHRGQPGRRPRPAPHRRRADRGGAPGPRHGPGVRRRPGHAAHRRLVRGRNAAPRAGPRARQAGPARHAPDRVRLRGHGPGRLRRRLPRDWRPPTPGCAAWSRCRARWRCSRSGSTAPRSRSRSGCPGWRRARRSAASA